MRASKLQELQEVFRSGNDIKARAAIREIIRHGYKPGQQVDKWLSQFALTTCRTRRRYIYIEELAS
jgi:hypothetical protein